MIDLVTSNARRQLRAEKRRAAVAFPFGALALDQEELLLLASASNTTSRGEVVRRRFVANQLRTLGIGDAAIARAWSTTAAELAALEEQPLLEKSGIAAAIDAAVLAAFPEVDRSGAYTDATRAAEEALMSENRNTRGGAGIGGDLRGAAESARDRAGLPAAP